MSNISEAAVPEDVRKLALDIAQQSPLPNSWSLIADLIAKAILADRAALSAAAPHMAGEPVVTDHKWFDPACHMEGCQSLVLSRKIESLISAGNKLSYAAQTSGGTAGRDDGLVAAVDAWTIARNAVAPPPSLLDEVKRVGSGEAVPHKHSTAGSDEPPAAAVEAFLAHFREECPGEDEFRPSRAFAIRLLKAAMPFRASPTLEQEIDRLTPSQLTALASWYRNHADDLDRSAYELDLKSGSTMGWVEE